MKVYFVRHGESELGEGYHQRPETSLGSVGKKQVRTIAQRFKNIPIDLIITSTHLRALQTAKEIEKVNSSPLILSDLLNERRMPDSFLGKSVVDKEIVDIHNVIREHFDEPGWHYAEEENFKDLISRADKVVDFILSQGKDSILVVTHGYFLTVIVYFLLSGESSNGESFKSFRKHTSNSNTGITLCEYKNSEWKLITWNDTSHLGES